MIRWQHAVEDRKTEQQHWRPAWDAHFPWQGRSGIGTIVIVLIALSFGIDPSVFLNLSTDSGTTSVENRTTFRPVAEDQLAEFVSVVLADTEDTWNALFQRSGKIYQEPKLVLFTDVVQSACSMAQGAMGLFYCPSDQKVYIDLSFYCELKNRFWAPGDFTQAYVIAHEVDYHVQNQRGILGKVHTARSRMNTREGNALSVRMELQADFLAGVSANHSERARHILEQGDVEEALNAASAIGDDRIQRQTQGRVVPDSFTHGTSQQQAHWFLRGLESGELDQCNSFKSGTF